MIYNLQLEFDRLEWLAMNFLKRSFSLLTRGDGSKAGVGADHTGSKGVGNTSPAILPANVRPIPFTLPLQPTTCIVNDCVGEDENVVCGSHGSAAGDCNRSILGSQLSLTPSAVGENTQNA